MTAKEFESLVNKRFQYCKEVLINKGNDYAPDTKDRLSNFREIAKRTVLNPLDIWTVLFEKHILSIETYMSKRNLESESIEDRITDTINYLLLGEALILEDKDSIAYVEPDEVPPQKLPTYLDKGKAPRGY